MSRYFLHSPVKLHACAFLSATALTLCSGSALAETVGPESSVVPESRFEIVVPGSWEGFYGGVHLGASSFNGTAASSKEDVGIFSPGGDLELRDFFVFGGGQVGYNFQSGNIIYGVEGDISRTDFNSDKISGLVHNDVYVKSEMEWLATLRGRLGLVEGNAMAYFTGGLAIAEVEQCVNIEPASPCDHNPDLVFAFEGKRMGFVAGAGVEMRLTERLSLKGEYLYTRLKEKQFDSANGFDWSNRGGGIVYNHVKFEQDAHLLRLGLNYHFNDLPQTEFAPGGPWSGIYAGLHLGMGAFMGRAMDWEGWNGGNMFNSSTGDVELEAFAVLGGVQAGANVQTGNAIFGFEADFARTGFSDDKQFSRNRNFNNAGEHLSTEMQWLATLRGRMGLAESNAMAYVTGGLAIAQMDYCAASLGFENFVETNSPLNTANPPCVDANNSHFEVDDIQLGLVAGVGVEARLSRSDFAENRVPLP
jgi:outer membrane immunogenic protein